MRPIAALTLVMLAAVATPALAQTADPAAARFDVGIGAAWIGRTPLGDTAATEATATGSRATLFNLSSELASAGGITAHAGVRIARAWRIEAAASYSRPELRIGLSGDTEAAPPVTA